jgi:hypothetical protein
MIFIKGLRSVIQYCLSIGPIIISYVDNDSINVKSGYLCQKLSILINDNRKTLVSYQSTSCIFSKKIVLEVNSETQIAEQLSSFG